MKKHIFSIIFLIVFYSSSAYCAPSLIDIQTAFIKHKYSKVQSLSEKFLSKNSSTKESYQVRYYLGMSLLNLNNYFEAERIFESMIQSDVPLVLKDKARLGLFDSLYFQDLYPKAESVINSMLKDSNDSQFLSLVYLKAARVNMRLSNWEKAYEYLELIIKEFPGSLEVFYAKQLLQEKNYYTVQVGSFVDRNHAFKLVNELNMKEKYAFIVESSDRNNKTFYRVRVGQLSLLNDAKKLSKELSDEGYPTKIYP